MLSGSRGPTGRLPHAALGGELCCTGTAPRAGRRGNLTWMATRRCFRLRRARFRDAPFSTRPRVSSAAALAGRTPCGPCLHSVPYIPCRCRAVGAPPRAAAPAPPPPLTLCSAHVLLPRTPRPTRRPSLGLRHLLRALPLEHAVARVCREAGAQVARNVRVGDMNIDVPVSDARRIEVVANGLPLWHGAQLAIDATIVSPVTRTGSARPGADTRPAAAVQDAARRKRRQTYPELQGARRARLVVLGIEVGGRFSTEAASFLRLLAQHRAASVAAPLRAAARAGWVQRWSGMLAVAAMRAYAASLLELPPAGEACVAGEAPELHEILADVRGSLPPTSSRLPAPTSHAA